MASSSLLRPLVLSAFVWAVLILKSWWLAHLLARHEAPIAPFWVWMPSLAAALLITVMLFAWRR